MKHSNKETVMLQEGQFEILYLCKISTVKGEASVEKNAKQQLSSSHLAPFLLDELPDGPLVAVSYVIRSPGRSEKRFTREVKADFILDGFGV